MESIGDLMVGFSVVLSWQNLLFMVIGIVLVVLGPMVTMRGDAETSKEPPRATDQAETAAEKAEAASPAKFEPKYAEGVVFGLLSAVGYGTSPILVR